jgi:lipoate-protein ligase A
MAIDDVLLSGVAASRAVPTLRLYRFDPPAVSVGRHQVIEDVTDLAWCRAHGVDVVRRPSGGGAILHDSDALTYAVVAPLHGAVLGPAVSDASTIIATALQRALRRLGIDAELEEHRRRLPPRDAVPCFARASRHELLWRGRKLAGSAQARRRRAVLQHGTLPLAARAERHRRATGATEALPIVTLSEAAGRRLTPDEVIDALVPAFREVLGCRFVPGVLSAAEAARVERLRSERYLDAGLALEGRAHVRWTA